MILLNTCFRVVRVVGVLVFTEGVACSTDPFAINTINVVFSWARSVLKRCQRLRGGVFLGNVHGKPEISDGRSEYNRFMQNQKHLNLQFSKKPGL